MVQYLSVTQYAEKYDIDGRNLRKLIAKGRLPEAVKVGNQWCIPTDAPRPEDRRVKSGKYRDWRKKVDKKPREG